MHAEFVINLGNKSNVPIISYSATNPSLISTCNPPPYFVRTTPIDSSQVKVITSIIDKFGWRQIVPIYVDNEFGQGIIPFLTDALDKINVRVPYRCFISPFFSDDQIQRALKNLKKMSIKVFVVHMSHELGSRLFAIANILGMLSEGYGWIITDSMASLLSYSDIYYMQGVIGIKPHTPQSEELDKFKYRWKLKYFYENNNSIIPQLDVLGFWAYDSATALAMAVEEAGITNIPFSKRNNNFFGDNYYNYSTDLDTIGISENGPKLLKAMLNKRFKGISGDFRIVNGQLQPPVYEIINIIDNGEVIGFWTEKTEGIVRKSKNVTNLGMGHIVWPGETGKPPKGGTISTKGERLKIGVPVKDGFNEFVSVTRNSTTNTSIVTGYCIDVFKEVVKRLGYPINYDFIPFENSSGKSAGTYNDLIYSVYERALSLSIFNKCDVIWCI